LFSRKKPFYLKRPVETNLEAAAGLVSNTVSPSFHCNTIIDDSTERVESESKPHLISSATQTIDDLCSQIDITPSDNGTQVDPKMSTDQALRDIQSFERLSFSVDSVDSEQTEVNKILFTEEDNSLATTPTRTLSSTTDKELGLIETTPRTRNFSTVSVVDTTLTDQHVFPIPIVHASTALRLDDLVDAAVDVLNISKNAINIFSKESTADISGNCQPSTQNYQDISKVLFVNAGVVTKKPLKSGCATYSESVTDVEMVLKTPSRSERKTSLIIGKTQSIVSSTRTPKRVTYEKDSDSNSSHVGDIFDDLDDSPDRAIRFSNCNFQVPKKTMNEFFDFENAYNPFEVSDSEDQPYKEKDPINAENVVRHNSDGFEELIESFDFKNAKAFGEYLSPNTRTNDEGDAFGYITWENDVHKKGSVKSSSEHLDEIKSSSDENIKSVINSLYSLSVQRLSPKSALQIMADECKDQLDTNVRKMAGASVSPESKSVNVYSEEARQGDRYNKFRFDGYASPPVPKHDDLVASRVGVHRKANVSPNNVFGFPNPEETNLTTQKSQNASFVGAKVKSPETKERAMKMTSVKERIALFNSHKW
jgi:hypothetical protein